VFERFTDRARRVVVLAQREAQLFDHNYIGTEHILLGLIHEGEGSAAKALESLGISLEAVRQQVEEIIGRGDVAPSGHIPFTPRTKKALELSLREALQLGHKEIGTGHILLGLVHEGEGVAAQILVRLRVDPGVVRERVTELMSGDPGDEPDEVSGVGSLDDRGTVRATPPDVALTLRRLYEDLIDVLGLVDAEAAPSTWVRLPSPQMILDEVRRLKALDNPPET
jgi:ATP-dependent Clp protease ATP-binding subunit ClpC